MRRGEQYLCQAARFDGLSAVPMRGGLQCRSTEADGKLMVSAEKKRRAEL